jgi:GntR family transcriptional regulator, transcriptional repressor for pyruvate dehydrogenase complex
MLVKTGDIITKSLIDAIVRGELGPGDKLASLEQLAKESGTSVLSVREAIQSLSTIGILDIRHGKGVYLTVGPPIIEDLLEARRTLECSFAVKAAETRNADMVGELEGLLEAMDKNLAFGDTEAYSEKDLEFHYAIGKASGNRILFKTLLNIRKLLRYQLFTINRLPNVISRSNTRHWEIFKAIRKGEPERARTWMWNHITETIETWKQDVVSLQRAQQKGKPARRARR